MDKLRVSFIIVLLLSFSFISVQNVFAQLDPDYYGITFTPAGPPPNPPSAPFDVPGTLDVNGLLTYQDSEYGLGCLFGQYVDECAGAIIFTFFDPLAGPIDKFFRGVPICDYYYYYEGLGSNYHYYCYYFNDFEDIVADDDKTTDPSNGGLDTVLPITEFVALNGGYGYCNYYYYYNDFGSNYHYGYPYTCTEISDWHEQIHPEDFAAGWEWDSNVEVFVDPDGFNGPDLPVDCVGNGCIVSFPGGDMSEIKIVFNMPVDPDATLVINKALAYAGPDHEFGTGDSSTFEFVEVFQWPTIDVPPVPFPVGGKIIPIETTSLLLANTQSFSWMIPVILSGIGIGLFVVSRKSKNS